MSKLDDLKAFLALMREMGVEEGSLNGFAFKLGRFSAPISHPAPDTPEERKSRLLDEMKKLAAEDDELETWSV